MRRIRRQFSLARGRAKIEYLVLCEAWEKCHWNLQLNTASVCGESLSRARVFQWHKRFRERMETTEDVSRSGRSSAMSTPKNSERVRDLLQQNCQITVRMFSELLYISKTACHKILHVDPGSPAVLIQFSCALCSFVLLQLCVCRILFSNCEQLIVCGSEWNFGTSPVILAATFHCTEWSTTYGHYCRGWFRGSLWSKTFI